MIVVADEQLFHAGDVRDLDRLALLRLTALGGHGFRCQSAPGARCAPAAPCPVEAWRKTLSCRLAQEARQLVDAIRCSSDSLAYGTDRILVSNRWDQGASCVVPLCVALRVLAQPLHLLVENGLREAAFIRRVLPADWRQRLLDWEATGKVRFENAGGIDEMREIVAEMTSDPGARRVGNLSSGSSASPRAGGARTSPSRSDRRWLRPPIRHVAWS